MSEREVGGKRKIVQGRIYGAEPDVPELSVERRRVLELTPPGSRVLEIGASTGYFSQLLKEKGCDVTAIELDEGAASDASGVVDRMVVGDVEDPAVLERAEGPFDVVLLMHVLEHLVDPWRVLRGLRREIAPGGRVLVLLPNVAAWTVRKDLFFKGRFEYTDVGLLDRTHLRFFTLESARDLLEDTGYEIRSWRPVGVRAPFEDLLLRLPLARRVAWRWPRWTARRWPNAVGEVLFFEAVPADGSL